MHVPLGVNLRDTWKAREFNVVVTWGAPWDPPMVGSNTVLIMENWIFYSMSSSHRKSVTFRTGRNTCKVALQDVHHLSMLFHRHVVSCCLIPSTSIPTIRYNITSDYIPTKVHLHHAKTYCSQGHPLHPTRRPASTPTHQSTSVPIYYSTYIPRYHISTVPTNHSTKAPTDPTTTVP